MHFSDDWLRVNIRPGFLLLTHDFRAYVLTSNAVSQCPVSVVQLMEVVDLVKGALACECGMLVLTCRDKGNGA